MGKRPLGTNSKAIREQAERIVMLMNRYISEPRTETLAIKAGVTVDRLRTWLKGETMIPSAQLAQIADALGHSADEIMGRMPLGSGRPVEDAAARVFFHKDDPPEVRAKKEQIEVELRDLVRQKWHAAGLDTYQAEQRARQLAAAAKTEAGEKRAAAAKAKAKK